MMLRRHLILVTAALGVFMTGSLPSARAALLSPWNATALGRALLAQGAGSDIDCTHPDVKDLPMCQNVSASVPPPPPGGAAATGPPNTTPMVGIAGHLWAYNRGVLRWANQDVTGATGGTDYLMRSSAGGVSIFMETRTMPFALSVETNLWFPKVERYRPEGEVSTKCVDCKWDVVVAIQLVGKVRIPAGKWVTPYPLLGLGFGAIQSLYRGREAESHLGVSFAAGAGVEMNLPVKTVTPFFELRYQLVSGYSHEKEPTDVKEWLHYHSVILALGLRFGDIGARAPSPSGSLGKQ